MKSEQLPSEQDIEEPCAANLRMAFEAMRLQRNELQQRVRELEAQNERLFQTAMARGDR